MPSDTEYRLRVKKGFTIIAGIVLLLVVVQGLFDYFQSDANSARIADIAKVAHQANRAAVNADRAATSAHHALKRAAASRRAGAIAGARTFLAICRDYRGHFTEQIRDQQRHLVHNLRLFGLKVTPQTIRIAHLSAERQLRRFDPEKCIMLPSVQRVERQYGVTFH